MKPSLKGWLFAWIGVAASANLLAAEPNYPVLNDIELTERVKDAGEKLMAEGKTKSTSDLAPQLKRTRLERKFEPVASAHNPLSDSELYQRACQSMFVLAALAKTKEKKEDWVGAFATGFAISADGLLTTSRHFFADPEPCDAFFAIDRAGKVFPVLEILASDAKRDTCVFRIAAEKLTPLPLGESPVPGARVRVVSHPGYFFYFFSSGSVGNYFHDDDSQTWMNITADFAQGSSGAPVFDDFGNVVGQATSTLTMYASGPPLHEPLIARRWLVKRPPILLVEKTPTPTPAPPEAEKPKKEKKHKPKNAPEPDPEESIEDPQMVFKTCTPIEALRQLIGGK